MNKSGLSKKCFGITEMVIDKDDYGGELYGLDVQLNL